ncbi:hypothetical protein DVS77_30055 [Mycolicibacterium moriokaense]|nr:hypothetical protein DVS77_30055 [Mycolicibacterium moriokaense]
MICGQFDPDGRIPGARDVAVCRRRRRGSAIRTRRDRAGAAASRYAALWEDWHDGAVTLIDALARSSRLLERAAVAYDEQETACERLVQSVPAEADF